MMNSCQLFTPSGLAATVSSATPASPRPTPAAYLLPGRTVAPHPPKARDRDPGRHHAPERRERGTTRAVSSAVHGLQCALVFPSCTSGTRLSASVTAWPYPCGWGPGICTPPRAGRPERRLRLSALLMTHQRCGVSNSLGTWNLTAEAKKKGGCHPVTVHRP